MKDNELIAKFHGWKHFPSSKGKGKGHWDFQAWGKAKWNSEFFEYHKNWSWLMPVVEKIAQIPTGDGDFYYPRTLGMRDADENFLFRINRFQVITAKTLIEAAHGAVVEFIKWYNENKNA